VIARLVAFVTSWWLWRVVYRHGLCQAESPPDYYVGVRFGPYLCTLPKRHRGLHVAQGRRGQAICVWSAEP
jgi:hypothetical protein